LDALLSKTQVCPLPRGEANTGLSSTKGWGKHRSAFFLGDGAKTGLSTPGGGHH
jgi:hypothetical protein